MKRLICLSLVCLASRYAASARDEAPAPATQVFQIGLPDGDCREFALAGDYGAYAQRFPHDANFVVGKSQAKRDWPWIHPGPMDSWAGERPHAFGIAFDLPEVAPGYYRLVVDLVDTHATAPPVWAIAINGTSLRFRLPPGHGDETLGNFKVGKHFSLEQPFPASLLRAGSNHIALVSEEGSWAIYDDVRLESGAAAPAQPLQLRAKALPWWKRSAEGLRRVVVVSVENLANAGAAASIDWKAGTYSGRERLQLHFGHNEASVLLPEVEEETTVELALKTGGQELKAATTLVPARKWRVFVVPTIHTDIGYTDWQERVRARHANNGMQALALAEKYPCFNGDLETVWQFDCFLQAHPEKAEAAFKRLREGRLGLSAFYGNMLTGLCSHEALNRATLSARDLANQGGFDFTSVILDDVPSAIGSLPTVLASAGIKYFIEGVNSYRAPYATKGLRNPFYWEGPDGSRVLSHIAPGYGMAGGFLSSLDQAAATLPGLLEEHDTPDYPYDAVLINGASGDNGAVPASLPQVVEQWNAQWEYPKLILGRPEDFFRYVERNFAARIPVLKTDFGSWWEDGAASSALETALCRRAEERAVSAEMLHSLAAVLGAADYPKADFEELWRNVLLYEEHTWGAWCSVSQPQSEQTVMQWGVKSSFARKADADSRRLLVSGMTSLAALAPAADLLVFNPLAWARKDVVVTESAGAVQDLATKRELPCQALPEGGACFIAPDLPAVGYRSYRQSASAGPFDNAVRFAEGQMENEFYRVSLDRQTGALRSILDKETGRELADPQSEYGLGEMIYVSGGEGSSAMHPGGPPPNLAVHRPQAVRVRQTNGPVFGELETQAQGEKLPSIILRVRLYHGLKRIDINCEFDKQETYAKEALYIAFPFALDLAGGGLWLEYPDAITQPLKDQNSTSCRGWYAVQRWLAASDGQATVVLSPLDTPLVALGGMTGSAWPRQLTLKRAHVFAYVMNNYWDTNYKASQGGRYLFRFSLTSAPGGFSGRDALTRGWEMFSRPVAQRGAAPHEPAILGPAGPLLGLEPAGLPLLAFKQAQDAKGFVLRLGDFAGAGGTATLTLPKPAGEAFLCNLVEATAASQESAGKTAAAPPSPILSEAGASGRKTVVVPLKPFGLATVKVRFE